MNTDTAFKTPKSPVNSLGQLVVSASAVLALLVAAILKPDLWFQFGVVLSLVLLTYLFIVRVNKLVRDSMLFAETDQMVSTADNQESKKALLAVQVAKYWPALSLVMALVAAGLFLANQSDFSNAFTIFSSVLLLSYSQSISLTRPVALFRTLKSASESGIMIRNLAAFEKAAKLTLVLFTKGGILTTSPTGVNAIRLATNSTIKDEHKLLRLAACVESMSNHAFARSITNSANKLNLKVTKPKDFLEIAGYGVRGVVGGSEVFIGSTAYLIQRNIRMEVQELIYADESTKNGFSIVCVVVDGHLEALLRFTDLVKPTSVQAVYKVALERIRVGIITGDSAGTAQSKAKELQVSEVYAELSPDRKLAFLSSEQAKGAVIGVIADPATDAGLLQAADLSVALTGESEVLPESVDVCVSSDDPELAAIAIALSAQLRRKLNLGLGFGLGYGVLSLLSYVAIVSPLQIPSVPALAALIGSLSVFFVTLNAYSLGKLK